MAGVEDPVGMAVLAGRLDCYMGAVVFLVVMPRIVYRVGMAVEGREDIKAGRSVGSLAHSRFYLPDRDPSGKENPALLTGRDFYDAYMQDSLSDCMRRGRMYRKNSEKATEM